MQIKHLSNEAIDQQKWDSCVHYANNGNVFGYRWFLNNISKDWDALVEGDYTSVMPIFWKQNKWSKQKSIYTPSLIRHAGLYSTSVLSTQRLMHFLNAIPDEFKGAQQLRLNEQNYLPDAPEGFALQEHKNYQLMMSLSYDRLKAKYDKDMISSIQKAFDKGYKTANNSRPEQIADFLKTHSFTGKNGESNFHASQRIMYNVLHRGKGFASTLLGPKGQLAAVNFLIYSHSRILSIFSAATPQAEADGAMNMIYDLIIGTHSRRPMLLDFNTSESWPEKFGAEESIFPEIIKQDVKWWNKV